MEPVSKKNMFKLMIVMFTLYLSLALPYVLAYPYMASVGYTATQQGTIMTAGALLGIVSQMIFGILCDRFRTIKKFVLAGNVIMVAATWFFYTQNGQQFLLHLCLGAVWNALFMNIEGMLDSWALEEDEFCKSNYGPIRAFGAIGWIVGSALVGWIVGKYSYQAIGISFVIASAVNIFFELITPDADKKNASDKEKMKLSDIGKLITNKRYIFVVIMLFLAFSMLVGEIFVTAQKMNALGLDTASTYTSMRATVQALCELPLFFLGGVLIKKFGANKLIVFALAVHVVRMILTALAATQMQLVLISVLQLFTYPCITVSMKYLVDKETPEGLKSTGQQFAYAIYISLAALLMPVLYGVLVDKAGLTAVIILTAVITVIPLFVFLIDGIRHKEPVAEE